MGLFSSGVKIIKDLQEYMDIFNALKYGTEVNVSNDSNQWSIHWFERIGGKGFHTTEGGLTHYRYIGVEHVSDKAIDFEQMKEYFKSIK